MSVNLVSHWQQALKAERQSRSKALDVDDSEDALQILHQREQVFAAIADLAKLDPSGQSIFDLINDLGVVINKGEAP